MSRPRRVFVGWFRIIGLLAALLGLGLVQGCSAIKLGYNNAPDLVYWWMDGYADLSETQTQQVREDLARLQQWHRGTELPRIADLLQKAQGLAAAPNATAEQACGLFEEARSRLDAVAAQIEPSATALAMGLTAAQLENMEAKFAKSNATWRDDWISGSLEKRQAKRLKTAVERAEQFYGSLDEAQVAILRDGIAASGFDPRFSYAERQRRQQDMLKTLRQVNGLGGEDKPAAPQVTAALRAYLQRAIHSPNAAYRAYMDKEIAENCKTLARLHNSTSAQQRERAVRRLAGYERDARELAARR